MTAQPYDASGLIKKEGECIPQMVSVQEDSWSNQDPQVPFSTLRLAQGSSRDGGILKADHARDVWWDSSVSSRKLVYPA